MDGLCRFFKDRLHPTNLAVLQHHLDAVGVSWTGSQDACDDSFGQLTGALVLFFHHLDAQAGMDLTAFGDTHRNVITRLPE